MNDRFRGTLIGLAVGDALGAAIEFRPPGSFPPVIGCRDGGPHNLKPGQWTDDTRNLRLGDYSVIAKTTFDFFRST
jgi:ADP-ribosyl-[dinitrogen reductase] hydrolase